MATPVGNNNITPQIAASGLGNAQQKYEAGSFVVNPPKNVYKFSVYDELDLGKDRYKELLQAVEPNSMKSLYKKSKARTIAKKIIKWGVVIGGAVLAFKHRVPVQNFFANIFNKVKKLVRR